MCVCVCVSVCTFYIECAYYVHNQIYVPAFWNKIRLLNEQVHILLILNTILNFVLCCKVKSAVFLSQKTALFPLNSNLKYDFLWSRKVKPWRTKRASGTAAGQPREKVLCVDSTTWQRKLRVCYVRMRVVCIFVSSECAEKELVGGVELGHRVVIL